MVNLTIDGREITVKENTTIMEAASQNGIPIPKLCYLKGINEIAACRVCVVELEGKEKLITSCNNIAKEGMVIHTNSPKVRRHRRTTVELILSQHDCECVTCSRSGNCSLQTVANDLNIIDIPFKMEIERQPWNKEFPLIRDSSKCIKCMRCVQVCEKVQGLGVWDVEGTGSRTTINVAGHRTIEEADCALCGQCITHCPVGALRVRDDTEDIWDAIADPDKIVVAQVAPAVRTAWGEEFGLSDEEATVGKILDALKRMGVDYAFDTTFSADLTIMEEGTEFLHRFTAGELKERPMFTSCCPGWVRFLKSQYPDMVDCLSTAKSPQQMQGAIIKNYFADKIHEDPENIFSVSIMPCIAKKAECALPTMDSTGTGPDVDVVLNTREFVDYMKSLNIDVYGLPEDRFDSPCGEGTGAAVIFGTTGGVMEAALRSCYYLATGENPDPDAFHSVRGMDGWKEASIDIAGTEVKVAVVSGLGNARKLIEAIRRGEVFYHFVEVMACPGGCVGGGGQPIHEGKEMAEIRSKNLYFLDSHNERRFSHENPEVLKTYEEYLEKPLSRMSHKLLHTDHHAWDMPLAPKLKKR